MPIRVSSFIGVVVVAVAAGCRLPAPYAVPSLPGLTVPDRVSVRSGDRIVSVALEEYVTGSVLAEVTPLNETPDAVARIYEVQAVVARTYVVAHRGRHRADGFDVCDTTHCQLYDPARIQTSRFSAAAGTAVRRTAGQVLSYGRRAADAVYHADCGGATTDAGNVWGGRTVPYLQGLADDVPGSIHRAWTFTATSETVRAALNRDPRTAVGTRLSNIEVLLRDASGRATSVVLRGERERIVRGEDLRAVLNRTMGDRGVQSTKFSVTRTGTSYRFDGAGFGHGVGLCQAGAAARARRGEGLADILRAYFKDAILARQ